MELTELETMRRFSVATRGATAPLAEVVEALRADLDALTQDSPLAAPAAEEAEATASGTRTTNQPSPRRATAKKTTRARSEGRKRSRVS